MQIMSDEEKQHDRLDDFMAPVPTPPLHGIVRGCDNSLCACPDCGAPPTQEIFDLVKRDEILVKTRHHGLWISNIMALALLGAEIYGQFDGLPDRFQAPGWAVAIVLGTYLGYLGMGISDLPDLLKAVLKKRS